HFDRLQPPSLRRTVQLTQVTKSSLAWTVGRSHRLHKRPIPMPLAILAALMRPQKHSCPILSWRDLGFKRVGLHYIGFRERQCCNQNTCQPHSRKNSRIFGRRDEPGLAVVCPIDAETVGV